jgi:hypothetical protein
MINEELWIKLDKKIRNKEQPYSANELREHMTAL